MKIAPETDVVIDPETDVVIEENFQELLPHLYEILFVLIM
jgi:tetrahydromethanopterin S-methyltransferase subunit B